jgi:hypothetical protein
MDSALQNLQNWKENRDDASHYFDDEDDGEDGDNNISADYSSMIGLPLDPSHYHMANEQAVSGRRM